MTLRHIICEYHRFKHVGFLKLLLKLDQRFERIFEKKSLLKLGRINSYKDMKFLTVTAAMRQIQQGQLLPSQLLEKYLVRLEQREPVVKAWTHLAIAAARQQAAYQDHQLRECPVNSIFKEQPLFGVPIGIKDIFATVDMPTAWGFPLYAGRYLAADAIVVRQLKAAGAIILGKTVTTELATAAAGPTSNPHNLNHTPGGSSSGSAAAVADGMVPLAIGSQTMGSVVRPAAYCGIFGFKPSFGLISRQGMMSVCEELDQVGFFARSINDLQIVFQVLATPIHKPIEPAGTAQMPKLAWVQTSHWPEITAPMQNRLTEAVRILQQAGITVEPVTLPPLFDEHWEIAQTQCASGLYQNHGELLTAHPQQCSPALRSWLERGKRISPQVYQQACQQGQVYRAAIGALFTRYDAILTPATADSAPLGLTNTGSPRFCALWTICGVPAITLPMGTTLSGLPLTSQLVGPWGQDQKLLQLAVQCWQYLQTIWGPLPLPQAEVISGR